MKKKNDIFFIASKSGRDSNTRASFYDEKGRNIERGDVKISYKSSVSGRFVTRSYTTLGRDSKTGEFIPVREANRRPNTTTVERVPKSGHGENSRIAIKKTPKNIVKKSSHVFKDMKKGSSISFKK